MITLTYTSRTDVNGNRYWLAATYSGGGKLVDLSPVMSKNQDYKIPSGSTIVSELTHGSSHRAITALHKDLAPQLAPAKVAPLTLKQFTESDYKNGLGATGSTYMDRVATSYSYAIDLDASQHDGGRMSSVVQIATYTIGSKRGCVIWVTLPNGETVRAVGPKRQCTSDALVAAATLFMADPGYNLKLDSLSRGDEIALMLARSTNPDARYATI